MPPPSCALASRRSCAGARDGARHGARIEGPKVFDSFADADRVDREPEFFCRRDKDAAARGAVELGHHQAGHPGRGRGTLRSGSSAFCPVVASSTRMTSCGASGLRRPSTRRTFDSSSIRWVLFCRRPAVSTISASIPVAVACLTPSKTIPAASPPSLPRDHRRADALAPNLELLDRRRAEGVPGGEQHAIILLLQPMGELANGRGLAASR